MGNAPDACPKPDCNGEPVDAVGADGQVCSECGAWLGMIDTRGAYDE